MAAPGARRRSGSGRPAQVVWRRATAVGALLQRGANAGRSAPASAGARKWRTSGTVSIRQADAASAIGSIEPVALIAQAPTSRTA